MTDLVIVADDLTGAADSAAPLVGRGATAVVVDAGAGWPRDAAVLSIDTDGRHLDASAAAARAAAAAAHAREIGAQVVKKIDSTLRGHVARELLAIREVLTSEQEEPLLVVAPAFPRNGRTTRGGVVHVDGRRLAAHDSDGDVVALLRRGGLRARAVPAAGSLAARLALAHAEGLGAIVVDAESDTDLERVVAAVTEAPVPALLVGSGGITRPMAGSSSPARDTISTASGATLVVVGSAAEASRRQCRRLLEHGLEHVVLGDPGLTAARLRTALAGGAALLSPDPSAPVVRDHAAGVAARLAETVAEVLAEIGNLVVTGGETARAVLVAAAVSRYLVTGEVEPGIVRGYVPELGLDVITKAGAFGDPDALLRCLPRPARAPRTREKGPTRWTAP